MKSKDKIEEASIASAVNGYLSNLKGSTKNKNIQERVNAVLVNTLSEAKLHGEYDPNDKETVSFTGKKYADVDRGEAEDETKGMSVIDPDKEEGSSQQSDAAKNERNKLRLSRDELNKRIRQKLFNMVSTDEDFRNHYQTILNKYRKNPEDVEARAELQKIRDEISKSILSRHNATVRKERGATDPKEYVTPIVAKVFKKLLQTASQGIAPSQEMIDFGKDVLNLDLRPSRDVFEKFVRMAARGEHEVPEEDVAKFVAKSLENPSSNLTKFAQSKLGSYPGAFRDKIEKQADEQNVPGKDEGGIGSMIKKLQIADPEYVKRRQMLQRGAMSGDASQQDQLTKLNAEFEKNLIPQLKDVIIGRSNIESTPVSRALKLISPDDAIKLYKYFKNNPQEIERSEKELDSRLPSLTSAKLPTPGSEIDKVATIGSEIAPTAKTKSGKEISTSLLNPKEKEKIKSDFTADQKKFEKSRDLSSMFGYDEDEQPVEARPQIKAATPDAKILWGRLIDPKNKDKKPIVGALIKTLTKALSTGDSSPVSSDKKLAVGARQALQDAESKFYDVRQELSSLESLEKQRGALRPDEQKKKQELAARVADARSEIDSAKNTVNKAEAAYKLSSKTLQKRKDISPEEVVQILSSLIVRGPTGEVSSLKDPEKINLPDEQKSIAKNIHYILGQDRLKKDVSTTGKAGGEVLAAQDLSVSRFLEPALDDYAQSEAERDVMNYPELEQDVKDSEKKEFDDADKASRKPGAMKLSSDEISNIDREDEERREKVGSGIKSRISDLHSEKDKLEKGLEDKLKQSHYKMLSKAKDESPEAFDDEGEDLDDLDDNKKENETDEDYAKRKDENDQKRSNAARKKSEDSDFEEIQSLDRADNLKKVRKELNKKISSGGKEVSIGSRIDRLKQIPTPDKAYIPGKVDLAAAKQRMAASTEMRNKQKIDSLLKKFSEGKEDSFSTIMMELLTLPGKKKLGHAEYKDQSWEVSRSPRKMKLIPDFAKQTKPSTKKKKAKKS